MEHRTIVQLGLAGVAGSLFMPRRVLAAAPDHGVDSPMAGGLY